MPKIYVPGGSQHLQTFLAQAVHVSNAILFIQKKLVDFGRGFGLIVFVYCIIYNAYSSPVQPVVGKIMRLFSAFFKEDFKSKVSEPKIVSAGHLFSCLVVDLPYHGTDEYNWGNGGRIMMYKCSK